MLKKLIFFFFIFIFEERIIFKKINYVSFLLKLKKFKNNKI